MPASLRSHRLVLLLLMLTLLNACATSEPDADTLPPESTSPTPQTHADVSILPTGVNAPAAAVTTISFGDQAANRATYQPLLDSFMAANPDVRVQFVANDTLYRDTQITNDERIEQIMHTADVLHVGFDATSGRRFARSGWLHNLTPFIEAQRSFDRADFYPGMLESVTFDDGVYMLPRTTTIPLLAYNKDVWEQRQLAPPNPEQWTWETMQQAAQQLAQDASSSDAMYGYADETLFDVFTMAAAANGVDFVHTPVDHIDLQQSAVITALATTAQLVQSNAVYVAPPRQSDQSGFPDGDIVRQQIATQKVGMWSINLMPYEPPAFTIGYVPFPRPFTREGADGYVMSGGTQHEEAAWRLMSFLSANEPPAWYQVDLATVPARISFAERTQYWAKLDAETTAVVQAVLAQPPSPAMDNDSVMWDSDVLMHAVRAVVSDKQSPEQALAAAQAALEQRLAAATATPAVTPAPFVVNTPVPAPAPAATSVRFAAVGLDAATLQPLTQQFQQQHPELAVQLVDARAGGLTFDNVAQQSDCFSYFQPPPLAAANAVADLQPRVDTDASFPRGDYPPGVLAPLQQHGRLLGLPLRIGLPALHANPAVFAVAGLPLPTANSTWSDLQATAQQLTSGRGAQQTLGFGMLGDLGAGARLLLRAQGVPLTTSDPPQPTFTSPAVQAALPPLLDLLRPSIPVSATLDSLAAQGQVALWLDTRPATPITTSADVDQLVPLPLSENGRVPVDITSALFISAQSQQPDACWTWLRFLADQPLSPGGDGYPARVSQAQSDTFTQHAQAGAADVYAAYLSALQQPVSTQDAALDVLRDDPLAARWFDQAIIAAMQGKDLTRALAEAQATTEAYLTCVQNGTDSPACARQVDPTYGEPRSP